MGKIELMPILERVSWVTAVHLAQTGARDFSAATPVCRCLQEYLKAQGYQADIEFVVLSALSSDESLCIAMGLPLESTDVPDSVTVELEEGYDTALEYHCVVRVEGYFVDPTLAHLRSMGVGVPLVGLTQCAEGYLPVAQLDGWEMAYSEHPLPERAKEQGATAEPPPEYIARYASLMDEALKHPDMESFMRPMYTYMTAMWVSRNTALRPVPPARPTA